MTARETVTLRGGVTVDVGLLRFLWDIEERGCTLRVDPVGKLHLVEQAEPLTEDELARLKRQIRDVKRIVAYEAPSS